MKLSPSQKEAIKKALSKIFGVRFRPVIRPHGKVLGSFTPLSLANKVGSRSRYFIHDEYTINSSPVDFDDTSNSDGWQNEVYKLARELLTRENGDVVVDFGCGSGYKLIKYFGDKRFVGIETKKTCLWLRRKYPGRNWCEIGERFSDVLNGSSIDIAISADVLEHVVDPVEYLQSIKKSGPKLIVLSTPDRALLRDGRYNGPPGNPSHIREWSFVELRAFLDSEFDVVEHFIIDAPQCTQCAILKIRS